MRPFARLHGRLCTFRAGFLICYIAGATHWGFAQRHTTNGVLSLDYPFRRSIEWLQLARRTSPPKGLGRARSFPSYQPPLAQRPERRPDIRHRKAGRVPMEGVQGQLPAGARWTLRDALGASSGPDPISFSRPPNLRDSTLRLGGEREKVPEAFNAWAQGVHRC